MAAKGDEPPSHAGCFVSNGTTMLAVTKLMQAGVYMGLDFGWLDQTIHMERFLATNFFEEMQTEGLSLALNIFYFNRKCRVI